MNALERLQQGRELNETRDADIVAARNAGHTWQEIVDATGLSRAMAARVYQNWPHRENVEKQGDTPRNASESDA